MLKKVDDEWSLNQLIDLNEDVDIILTEGYKRSDMPKIEVVREERSKEHICRLEELLALATDTDLILPGIPSFHIDDAVGLVDLIEKEIMNK
jgi:molybdopterin-guanine dinucleotide biosynthesis protein B